MKTNLIILGMAGLLAIAILPLLCSADIVTISSGALNVSNSEITPYLFNHSTIPSSTTTTGGIAGMVNNVVKKILPETAKAIQGALGGYGILLLILAVFIILFIFYKKNKKEATKELQKEKQKVYK